MEGLTGDNGQCKETLGRLYTFIFEPPIFPSRHINFLYSCLSAKIAKKFESDIIKFHKSLYAETGKLDGSNIWVYKTGPLSYTLLSALHVGQSTWSILSYDLFYAHGQFFFVEIIEYTKKLIYSIILLVPLVEKMINF